MFDQSVVNLDISEKALLELKSDKITSYEYELYKSNLIESARKYCISYHKGQIRRNKKPYSDHPIAVENILIQYGYNDYITRCIALLHDAVEDTDLITSKIKFEFGYQIANGVYNLSRNTLNQDRLSFAYSPLSKSNNPISNDDLYKLRLSFARKTIQKVKIADMIDVTRDLHNLRPTGIERKLKDTEEFYIPLGKIIAPEMTRQLEFNIKEFNLKKK